MMSTSIAAQAMAVPAEPVNARLLAVATGKTPHLYAGRCPDSVNGPEPRDPDCPACQAIAAAEAQPDAESAMTRADVLRLALEAGFTWEPINNIADPLERFAALVMEAKDGPWKAAVIDQLIIAHTITAEHENDPLKAVQDLLAYHADIAVDPRVSGAAAKLVEQAKAEEREACAKVCESRQTPGTGSVAILQGAADAILARGQK